MEAKDIRVGNWIFSGENYVRVENIMPYGINYMAQEEDVDYDINGISGIPLTEEILLKCGFKYDCDLVNSLCKCGIWFNKKNMESTYLSQKLIKINYLHQLQNLYWCLCEEELEVNL